MLCPGDTEGNRPGPILKEQAVGGNGSFMCTQVASDEGVEARDTQGRLSSSSIPHLEHSPLA